MSKKNAGRIISLFVVAALVLSLFPVAVFAGDKGVTVRKYFEDETGYKIKAYTTTTVQKNGTFNDSPDIIPGYIYIGYIINDSNATQVDAPAIPKFTPTVDERDMVTYIYKKAVIVRKYFEDDTGDKIKHYTITTVPLASTFNDVPDVIPGYTYIGYCLESNARVPAPAIPKFTASTPFTDDPEAFALNAADEKGMKVTYVYRKNDSKVNVPKTNASTHEKKSAKTAVVPKVPIAGF